MIYLDNAATTAPCEAALNAFQEASRQAWGNPSSLHSAGREARAVMEAARKTVAEGLGLPPNGLVFTSGGTESINLALRGSAAVYGRRKKKIVTTTLEHSAVYETLKVLEMEGFSVSTVSPGSDGRIDPEKLASAVTEDTFLVSAVQVCPETGAVLDMSALYAEVKRRQPDCLLHIDGVQGFRKVEMTSSFDLYSLSGHKIHAPRGIGALYVKDGVRLAPQMSGGGQERNLRSGSEAVPLMAALAAAVEWVSAKPAFKEAFLAELLAVLPGAVVIPPHDSPHILSFAFPGIPSEALVRALSDKGLFIGAGSACAKGRRSRALLSMGIPTGVADSVVRVSFSQICDASQLNSAVEIIRQTVAEMMT